MSVGLPVFLLPGILSFLTAVFEGVAIALLAPTLRGLMTLDYRFLKDDAWFQPVLKFWPEVLNGNSRMFLILISLIIVAFVLKNICLYFSGLIAGYQAALFGHQARKKLYERMLSFGKLYFDQHNAGELTEILQKFSDSITHVMTAIRKTLIQICMIAVYFVLMLKFSLLLTGVLFLAFPFPFIFMKVLINKTYKTAKDLTQNRITLSSQIYNVFSCIPLIKASSFEAQETTRLTTFSDRIRNCEFSIAKKRELVMPMQEIMNILSFVLVICAVAFLIFKKQSMDVATFMVFFVLFRRLYTSVSGLSFSRLQLEEYREPIQRVRDILSDTDKPFVTEGTAVFQGLKSGIYLKGLSFQYGSERKILRNLTGHFEKGKMTAIVGESGSGKSTLASLLMRFYEIPNGSICLDDQDIKIYSLKSLHEYFAYVSQNPELFNDTLRENIVYGLSRQVDEDGLKAAVEQAKLTELIRTLPLGLNTEIGDRGIKLSGGERQRVAIARAILKKTEIIILDEATSSLDSKTEKHIQEAIEQLLKKHTSIVIAHRLSTIQHADKIIVMKKGEFVEQGGFEELINKKGAFYELWSHQAFVS